MTVRVRRFWTVGATALIVAVTAAIMVAPAAAQSEEEEVRLPFGPVGIAHGQTAVLNVVLLAVPPSPCQITLSFYDPEGQVLGTREEPAMTVFTLEEPNVTESFELSADQTLADGQVRVRILPAVQLPPNPCADLVATLEIYGPGDQTRIYWTNPGPPNSPTG
jgi:hypothetical protein